MSMGAIPEFESDAERYEWEVWQRFNNMSRLDRWLAADGVYTIGPPIPPKAKVFTDKGPGEAFSAAGNAGYLACRPASQELGISRTTFRRIFDKMPGLSIAYVVYNGKIRGSRYHCRMLHRRSVDKIKQNLSSWVKGASVGGKRTTDKTIRRSG